MRLDCDWRPASLALLLPLAVTGCFGPSPLQLAPINRGTDFTAHQVADPNSGGVFESNVAIAGGRLTLRVTQAAGGDRIKGAQVTLLGPTPAGATTPDVLDLTFQPLEAGTYYARVAATGYVPQLVGPITLDSKTPVNQTVSLLQSGGDVTGRVVDSSGAPLSGARINLGEAYAFSNADGTFRLQGVPTGAQSVAISKTGYTTGSAAVTVGSNETPMGDLRLPPGTRVVSLENAGQPFAGSTVGAALGALIRAITTDGFTVQNGAAAADVRVVASPTAAWAGDVTTRAESLRTFVAGGGKLILMGEWGGFGDYTPSTANALAHPYGLGFNPDLVRINPGGAHSEWLSIPAVSSLLPAAIPIPAGLQLFEACSLFAPAPAQPLATTGTSGFRVTTLLTGNLTVAAARPYGKGLVITLGDTSAWVSPGTRNGNASNLAEASNQAFMLDLFHW